jgi:anti-sigma-K factor RskA
MTSIDHQTDLVEAYALGVLEPREQEAFEAHAAECAECRTLARASEDAAQMLALVVAPAAPPLRCKRTVLERIEREQFLHAPTPRRAARRVSLSTWTAVAAVCAMMVTGGWAMSLRTQTATLQSQLESANSDIAEMQNAMAAQAAQTAQMQQQLGQFINFTPMLAEGEEICLLKNEQVKASARCLARPGDNQAMIFVSGLPPLPAAQSYQLWLANDQEQAPLAVFNTQLDGTAPVAIVPNAPLDRYSEIMVTVENVGGGQTPSKQIVLDGELQ